MYILDIKVDFYWKFIVSSIWKGEGGVGPQIFHYPGHLKAIGITGLLKFTSQYTKLCKLYTLYQTVVWWAAKKADVSESTSLQSVLNMKNINPVELL